MSKEGTGRVIQLSERAKTRYITIPAAVAGDDRFPFQDNETVTVTISDNEKVIITKAKPPK